MDSNLCTSVLILVVEDREPLEKGLKPLENLKLITTTIFSFSNFILKTPVFHSTGIRSKATGIRTEIT